MARNRIFKWVDPDGNSVLLSDYSNGIRVLRGVTGLGMSPYVLDKQELADQDSFLVRGVRATGKQIFLPLEILASSRHDFLARKQSLAYFLDPQRGPGYLYVTDGGVTYRIPCFYADGLLGDEGASVSGEDGDTSWVSTSITFQPTSPFFEAVLPSIIGPYGYNAGIPFFPILPLKLSSAQVLSDASQPATKNKVLNPSFELNDTYSWQTQSIFGGPPVVGTPTNLLAGAGSHACRLDFPAPDGSGNTGSFFTIGDGQPYTNGGLATIAARIWVPSGQPQVQISSWDSAGSTVDNDKWEWVIVPFSPSFSLNSLLLFSQVGPRPFGGYCYIDQALMIEGAWTDYVDGDQPNCHWTGTPHHSTSYRDPVYAPTTIHNSGNKTAFPILKVTGPGTQLDLYHRGLDQHVTLDYPIPAGRVVTVDMANGLVTLDDDTNLYGDLSADDFWALVPGDNITSLSLVNAAAGSSISGYYYARYLGIV